MLNPFRFWGALTPLSAIRLRVLMLWVFVLGIAMHVVVTVPGTVGYYSRLQSRQGYWLNQFNSKGVYAYPELAFNRLFEHVFEMRYQGTPSGPGEIKIWFDWGVSFLSIIARPVSLSVGINMMWLAVLLLIPTTRRLAKIRTAHVLRAFLLSMIAAMVVFQAARFNLGMRSYYWRTHITLLGYRPALQILVIWQLVYWPVVIHIGWKIQKSKLLIALGSTAAILFGLLLNITIFILPDLL
ncbi:MAG: hypothetical protein AB8C13_07340 [Phycisphaerales bacterium]